MLGLDPLLAAAELGAGAPILEGVQDVLHQPWSVLDLCQILRLLTGHFRAGKRLRRPLAPGKACEYRPARTLPMREIIVGDGTGMAAGGVRNLLRVEGLVLFSTMLVAYETVGGSW